MIGIARRASAATIERARRLYTGVDPDTRAKLTPADSHRMTGLAIAQALDVHPHTVDGWIQRFAWSRPAWYRKASPRFSTRPAGVPPRVAAAIERAAASGEALPDNWRLARTFGCSLQAVSHALRLMRKAGEIRSERDGPRRRLVLKDGRATAWTVLPVGVARQMTGSAPVERPSLQARVLSAVTQWAAEKRPMPTDEEAGAAVGCSRWTFGRMLQALRVGGALDVENLNSNRRRVHLPEGSRTDWTALPSRRASTTSPASKAPRPVHRSGPLDLAVDEAVRALRRQGPVVFDLSVVTDCAPGVAWSVDSLTMTRAELLDEAARRNARAIERLAGAGAMP